MSIRQKQITNIANDLLKKSLVSGVFPRQSTLLDTIKHYLQIGKLGKPQTIPNLIMENDTSNPIKHNVMLDEIHTDMDMLYKEILDRHEAIHRSFVNFEAERQKLIYEIQTIMGDIKGHILVADKTNDYLYTLHDYFIDFSKINTSLSDVHIEDNTVTISKQANHNIKLDIDGSIISTGGSVSGKQPDPMSALIDEDPKTAWRYLVETPSPMPVSCRIHIQTPETIMTNRIKITTHSPASTIVVIRYTPDNGLNWFTIHEDYVGNVLDLNLTTIQVSALDITLIKSTPDITDNNDRGVLSHLYHFGISDISLFHVSYGLTSTLESIAHAITPNQPIEKIALWTDEEIPAGTEINYQLKINNNWIHISPLNRLHPQFAQTISLSNIISPDPVLLMMSSVLPPVEYELPELTKNGISFYKLGTIAQAVVEKKVQLYKGKNMWKVSTYPDNIIIQAPVDLGDIEQATNQEYQQILMATPGLLLNNKLSPLDQTYRFSTTCYLEHAHTLNIAPISNTHMAIYLHQQLIYTGTPSRADRVNYLLRPGWNTLDFFIYIPRDKTIAVDILLNLPKYAKYLYAEDRPLEQVSLFDLQHNTRYNDDSKYALIIENNKTDVILNHGTQDIPFDMFYKYQTNSLTEVTLRAELSRDDRVASLSPRLKGYQIRFA